MFNRSSTALFHITFCGLAKYRLAECSNLAQRLVAVFCQTTVISRFLFVFGLTIQFIKMELKSLKEHISNFPKETQFNYGISKPFSWRGSYDEVAFSIVESPMTREEILANIELAYTETFYGYKGGVYQYNDWTTVNFEEEGSRNYSDGAYTAKMIAKIENADEYISQEERLVKLAFV